MMRPRISPFVLCAFTFALGIHPLAAQPAKRAMSIEDIMAMKNVGAHAISPNGAQVVFTVGAWEHPNAKGDSAKGLILVDSNGQTLLMSA